jgi:hypothetical protein
MFPGSAIAPAPGCIPCFTAASTLSSTGANPAGACAYETRRGMAGSGLAGVVEMDGAFAVCDPVPIPIVGAGECGRSEREVDALCCRAVALVPVVPNPGVGGTMRW